MLNLRFAPFAAFGLSAALAIAQEPATSAAPKASAAKARDAAPAVPARVEPVKAAPARARNLVTKTAPTPVATSAQKKPGFWERVFGRKKPTPAPATPAPTPAPKKKKIIKPRAPKPRAAVDASAANPHADKPKNDPIQPGDESPAPTNNDEKPKATLPKPAKTKSATHAQDLPPSSDNPDAEVLEKQKYDQAKAKAVADPKVQELRGKADLAPSEEESLKALRNYNKAMFKRMKEIDPSIKDHIDRMESAVMNRLGGE